MVLQKRSEYGFNGYQVPATPRATRSARKRCSFKKKVEDNKMCSIDLLATIAGKLLLEKEASPVSTNTSTEERRHCPIVKNVKKETQDEDKPLKINTFDKRDSGKEYIGSEPVSHPYTKTKTTTSGCSDRFDVKKLVNCKTEDKPKRFACEEGGDGLCVDGEEELFKPGNNMRRLPDPVVFDAKPPGQVSLGNGAKVVPVNKDQVPLSCFPANRDNVNLVHRDDDDDDDENSSGCTHRSTTNKSSFRATPRIGDRRIRKILASKYLKVPPKAKDNNTTTLPSTDMDSKSGYGNRNNCYKRLRSERNYPIKKRKYFNCISTSNSDGGISSEGVSDSPEININGDDSYLHPKMQGASLVVGQHGSGRSRDSQVKLRIKSFRVPELFIEISETATVGSLKRTVMEAVTAVLGGGLRVGVLLQGKKVRDDCKTLLQAGISQDYQSDALGFCLEPNSSQTYPSLCAEDSARLLPQETPRNITRYQPAAPGVVQQGSYDGLSEPHRGNMGNFIESDHDSAPSPTDISADKSTTDSRALVAVPTMNVEALSVVPAHRKSKRSEVVQRRIRRPFSVSEVEALVQAVEKLGTGRWRDVKLRAFDNAKHRTYVDLKDKWKTLVHTARISPQQRRGEPVPQDLLDRVLSAHAYWSQQQAKQQLKQQQQHPETCLLLLASSQMFYVAEVT